MKKKPARGKGRATKSRSPAPSPTSLRKPSSRAPSRSRDRKGAVLAEAIVVDPERLLSALEQAEHRAPTPPPPPQPLREEPAPTSAGAPPASESSRHLDAVALRENETAVTTGSGTLVIRRRRAA
jgi:hypothetical protein